MYFWWIYNIIQYEILIYAYYPKENNKKLYKIVHIHHYNYSFIYKIELKKFMSKKVENEKKAAIKILNK